MPSTSRNASRLILVILISFACPPFARAGDASTWSPLATIYGDRLAQIESAPAAASIADSGAIAGAGETKEKASRPGGKKPLLYSLLLPGLGELSMGEKGRGIGFMVAEGLIWANYAYWTVAGNLREDDFIDQAQLNAGIGVDKESDDYWRLVGQYDRSSGSGPNSYEEELRREARDAYPGDPVAQDAYVAEKLPVGDRAWEWSSTELMQSYQDARERSHSAFHRAKFSIAAAILNRVVSVIDVQLLRHHAAKEAESSVPEPQLRVYADAAANGGGRLVIQRRF